MTAVEFLFLIRNTDAGEYAALGSGAYRGAAGEDRAQKNLQKFIEAHVLPQSPWKEGDKVEAIAGNTLWVEEKDGKRLVMIPYVSRVE